MAFTFAKANHSFFGLPLLGKEQRQSRACKMGKSHKNRRAFPYTLDLTYSFGNKLLYSHSFSLVCLWLALLHLSKLYMLLQDSALDISLWPKHISLLISLNLVALNTIFCYRPENYISSLYLSLDFPEPYISTWMSIKTINLTRSKLASGQSHLQTCFSHNLSH